MTTRSRPLPRALLVALLSAFLVVGFAAPSLADHHGPSVVKNDPSSTTISNTQTTTTTTPGQGGSPGSGGSGGSGDSGGSGGSGGSTFPGIEPATGPGTGACDPAAYPGGYSPTLAVPAPCAPVQQCGAYQGSVFVPEACPADPADPQAPVAPVITTQMVTEAAKVTAPVSPPHVEPGNRSYVNIPNNYWTDAPTVNTSITLLGQRIPLRWAPISTTWNFGDGGTATGEGVEGADVGAAGALEHSYLRQGSYDITTTTSYNLTFVIPGGGAQTVQLVSPPSPPVTLPVSEIQTRVSYVR